MNHMEGAWYTRGGPEPLAHNIWATASGSALTHCLATARVHELRPRVPSDRVCPDCWSETTPDRATS